MTTSSASVAKRGQAASAADDAPAYPEQFSTDFDLPLHDDRGSRRALLIASTGRCGSHFLGHAIKEMGCFGVPLEYLNPGTLFHWRRRFGIAPGAPHPFEQIARHRTSPSGWFAFKAHWPQFAPFRDDPALAAFGRLQCALFIYRRDLAGQAISFLKAQQTRVWISGAPARGVASYDYDGIMRCARIVRKQNRAWTRYFAGRPDLPVKRLVYEDLTADPVRVLGETRDFIDPACDSPVTASTRTRRQSDGTSDAWRDRLGAELRPDDAWILEPQSF